MVPAAYCAQMHLVQHCGLTYAIGVLVAGCYTAIAFLLGLLVWQHRKHLPKYQLFLPFCALLVLLGVLRLGDVTPSDYWLFPLRIALGISFLLAGIWMTSIVDVIGGAVRTQAALAEAKKELAVARVAEAARARFLALVSASGQLIIVTDPEGNITEPALRRWSALTSLSLTQGAGLGWLTAIHPSDKETVRHTFLKARLTSLPFSVCFRLRTSTGYRTFQLTATPVTDPSGNITEWVGAAADIEDVLRSRELLRATSIEAAGADRLKNDFLAVMSHELRTPLTAVMGYAELLGDGVLGPLVPKQAEAVTRIHTSGDHLVGLIDQLLDYSAFEAGTITVQARAVPVAKLVSEAVDHVRPACTEKGLALSVTCPKDLLLVTDPVKLKQVLTNLLTNALKYTDAGSIRLEVETGKRRTAFRVHDTGIGIPEAYQDLIFEKFWQADRGLTRRAGGAGLGLAITKCFVTALGGEIYVASELDQGSTFTVVLPT